MLQKSMVQEFIFPMMSIIVFFYLFHKGTLNQILTKATKKCFGKDFNKGKNDASILGN